MFRHALFQFKLDLPHLTTSDILDDTHMIPCSYIVSPFLAFRACLDIQKPTLRRLLVSYILSCSLFIRGLLNHLGVSLSLWLLDFFAHIITKADATRCEVIDVRRSLNLKIASI